MDEAQGLTHVQIETRLFDIDPTLHARFCELSSLNASAKAMYASLMAFSTTIRLLGSQGLCVAEGLAQLSDAEPSGSSSSLFLDTWSDISAKIESVFEHEFHNVVIVPFKRWSKKLKGLGKNITGLASLKIRLDELHLLQDDSKTLAERHQYQEECIRLAKEYDYLRDDTHHNYRTIVSQRSTIIAKYTGFITRLQKNVFHHADLALAGVVMETEPIPSRNVEKNTWNPATPRLLPSSPGSFASSSGWSSPTQMQSYSSDLDKLGLLVSRVINVDIDCLSLESTLELHKPHFPKKK